MYSKAKLGLSVLILGSTALWAHHQFSSEFDANRPVTLTGTVSRVDWTGPHASLYMHSQSEGGVNQQLRLEMASPAFLTERGIKASAFKAGEQLTVHAYRATDGSRLASARVITTAKGEDLQVADPQDDGGPLK